MSAVESTMKRFLLVRNKDISGTSGIGTVAEGVEFSNGQCTLHWLSQLDSVAVYANMKVLQEIHGHQGATSVQWVD